MGDGAHKAGGVPVSPSCAGGTRRPPASPQPLGDGAKPPPAPRPQGAPRALCGCPTHPVPVSPGCCPHGDPRATAGGSLRLELLGQGPAMGTPGGVRGSGAGTRQGPGAGRGAAAGRGPALAPGRSVGMSSRVWVFPSSSPAPLLLHEVRAVPRRGQPRGSPRAAQRGAEGWRQSCTPAPLPAPCPELDQPHVAVPHPLPHIPRPMPHISPSVPYIPLPVPHFPYSVPHISPPVPHNPHPAPHIPRPPPRDRPAQPCSICSRVRSPGPGVERSLQLQEDSASSSLPPRALPGLPRASIPHPNPHPAPSPGHTSPWGPGGGGVPGLCQGCAGDFGTCLSPKSRANVHAGTGAAPGTAVGSRAPSPPRLQAMDLEARRRRREGSEEAESSQKYSVLYFILQTTRTRCWEAPRRAHAGGGMGGTRCRARTGGDV